MFLLQNTNLEVTEDCRGKGYFSESSECVDVPKGTWGFCTLIIGEWYQLSLTDALPWSWGKETDEKYGMKTTTMVWIHESHLTRKFEG